MYVDYGYYVDQYGGGITEKEFPSAERKAEAYIRKMLCVQLRMCMHLVKRKEKQVL